VTTVLILLGTLAVAAMYYIGLRNSLVAVNQRANTGWSSIEVQLKRRHDMIPNLVKAVGSAQRHERGIFDSILKTREAAITALATKDAAKISAAEAALSEGLRSFMSYAEDNPEITATGNVNTLQRQIEDTEDQIAAARRFYNATIEGYNTSVESFPGNIVAGQMGLNLRQMIEFSQAERAAINTVPDINL
jgi:LemA protein